MYKEFVDFVRDIYKTNEFIPLHAPFFAGNEKQYLSETIDSTFVSSVGENVEAFEKSVAEFVGSKYAIATNNGTAALHAALIIAGVESNDVVLTQAFTFIATCNAITYCNATPSFIDINKKSLSLCPDSLQQYLESFCEIRNDNKCWNKKTNKRVTACVPMHSFGFPANLTRIKLICDKYNIKLIEDAAESLGSKHKNYHTGTVGELGVLSFNGNKIITCGGGGMILTEKKHIAERAKHITTTAKLPHIWEFEHDEIGYNYRLPNLNAALGLAQMENIDYILRNKRELAEIYQSWGERHGMSFVSKETDSEPNFWLNTVVMDSIKQKEKFLEYTNRNHVMTRPAWKPMHKLPMYNDMDQTQLDNTEFFYERIVNVPSSVVS